MNNCIQFLFDEAMMSISVNLFLKTENDSPTSTEVVQRLRLVIRFSWHIFE